MTLPSNENKELCRLININKDACTFYDSAQSEVEAPQLKTTFSNLKNMHSNVMANIETYMRRNGSTPEAKETLTGQTSQLWGELMAKISNDVDETLVKHLEEAEDRCLHSVQDALKENSLSPATKTMLQHELNVLQKGHDYMKSLKDQMKAA